jgi:hypothetical protein
MRRQHQEAVVRSESEHALAGAEAALNEANVRLEDSRAANVAYRTVEAHDKALTDAPSPARSAHGLRGKTLPGREGANPGTATPVERHHRQDQRRNRGAAGRSAKKPLKNEDRRAPLFHPVL